VRDHAYLNWRYEDCPTPYQIWIARRNAGVAGYVVSFASPAEPIAYIVDLFTSPEDTQAASLLVRTAVDSLLAEGLQLVYTWTLQSGASSVGHQLLKRACAIASRNPLHLAMRFLDKGIDTSRLPSDGWHLVTGDFDGV
jgi:hypothetical protein